MSDDPMEMIIEMALRDAHIRFSRESRNAGRPQRPEDVSLDFYLPDIDVYIEVKQFHSARTAAQLSQADNVILAQGRYAVEALGRLIRGRQL